MSPYRPTVAGTASAMTPSMMQVSSWSRDLRLGSGLVLMTFAFTHFLNHALGVFGIATMEAAQDWRMWVWRSWPGTILLYGAFIVHPLFALLRVAQRRTFRMPAREMVQIALGLLIPVLLVDHIVSTRVIGAAFGRDESYSGVLPQLWPANAVAQSLLLLLVWTHGVLGLHFILRSREDYARYRDVALMAAVLVPVLALIGFVVAGRESQMIGLSRAASTPSVDAMFTRNVMWGKGAFFAVVGCFVAYVVIREIRVRTRRSITVRFVGHGVRKVAPGLSLLEMFRRFGIPHAALCGGRARCATCRVLVLDGAADLPPPAPNEARLLKRISAPDRVRLACQIRPRADLQVRLLLAAKRDRSGETQIEIDPQLGRKGLTVMVADLRAFTAFSERQLPHELINLLNRFFDEMAQAITAHDGRIEAIYGDGLMAIFGLETTPARAALGAIGAAGDMIKAVEALNREFGSALPLPLRMSIGIHSGRAVVGQLENESLGRHEITVGETVMVANQLEAATRRVLADILVSEETLKATGRRFRGTSQHRIAVKGRATPILAFGFDSAPRTAEAEEVDEVGAVAAAALDGDKL